MKKDLETITVEFDDDLGIGSITITRSDRLNAINDQLISDFIDGLHLLEDQNEKVDGIALRTIVIQGKGGNFSAGADIEAFGDDHDRRESDLTHLEFIREFHTPIIAKIKGYCLGGGLELAMSCDFRIAHEDTKFGLPEIDLGLIPGGGGVQLVSRESSPAVAMELAMTGEHRSAEWAKHHGLVNMVVTGRQFDEETQEFAALIAEKPPLAIRAIKKATIMSRQTGLDQAIRYDRELYSPLSETDDYEKGVRAFAEEDFDPEFKGK